MGLKKLIVMILPALAAARLQAGQVAPVRITSGIINAGAMITAGSGLKLRNDLIPAPSPIPSAPLSKSPDITAPAPALKPTPLPASAAVGDSKSKVLPSSESPDAGALEILNHFSANLTDPEKSADASELVSKRFFDQAGIRGPLNESSVLTGGRRAEEVLRITKQAPDAVIFDWDDTLVDEQGTVDAIRKELFRELGVPTPSANEADHAWRTDRDGFYSGFFPNVPREVVDKTYYAVMERLRKKKELSGRPLNKPLPGAISLLKALRRRGIPLAVVSNKPEAQLLWEIKSLGISDQFQYVQGHIPGRNLKPSAQPIIEALESMAIAAPNVWYVGDQMTDMEAARAAGLQGIFLGTRQRDEVLRLFGRASAQAVIAVDSHRDLLSLIVKKLPARSRN